MGKVQSHKGVTGVENGKQYGGIGLGSRVGLYVGPLGTKQFFHSLAGKVFHLVYYLATAIVALAWESLSVFVGKTTAHCLHHLVADEILGGDEFHSLQLALVLALNKVENYLVSLHLDI